MKIVSTGSTLSSPEFHQKRKRARRVRLALWLGGMLALLLLLIFLSRQEQLLIAEVMVEGAKVVSEEAVELSVRQLLAGHYLGLVPRANALVYPRRQIEESLLKDFPRFRSLELTLDGLRMLKVKVLEREPFALYCASATGPENTTACYFLDEEGFIFDWAPSFSGTVYFVYAVREPFDNPQGQEFMPAREFKALARFIETLSALGLNPLALELGEDELNLVLSYDARLIWRRSSDLDHLYSNLEAFLNEDSIRNQKDFLKKLFTLDLRTENKVFYKFK